MTRPVRSLLLAAIAVVGAACGSSYSGPAAPAPTMAAAPAAAPVPDPRVGLRPGLFDAGQASWNLRLLATMPPNRNFVGAWNSDLAFTGHYAIQGNYNGMQFWDIADPRHPALVVGYVCPASQSDVSVYQNLLFVSGEGLSGRLDCGLEGVDEAVSHERLRGIRIFDISDIRNPQYIANVQTCRGSHTHTVLADPRDRDNVYIYVSGSSTVRPEEELPGCVGATPAEDPRSALFRIEVIRVPLAHPEQAAIVSSPRIFNDLVAPPRHGMTAAEIAAIEQGMAPGDFLVRIPGNPRVLPGTEVAPLLDSVMRARGGRGSPAARDTAAVQALLQARFAPPAASPEPGPTQCHDITVYPAIGLAGGACRGYGLLLDISDPVNPVRIDAASDSNFSTWHSATFSNDGSKVLFSDEWGGGSQPKCRATDPYEWGADAIFTLENRRLRFQSYYKLPAAQTEEENCVAHNGSLIPIPGRDVMVQGWYQGGISVFDWTDASHPVEIAFFDRGPVDGTRMEMAGSWSVYWYNGVMVSSEIARGLDIFELTPSALLSANEIAAAASVHLDYLNAQGQPHFTWPTTFVLAGAYVDQLERSGGLPAPRIVAVREALGRAERASGSARRESLTALATALGTDAARSSEGAKVRLLADVVRRLAG